MANTGERMGAILKADAETVWLIGYGVYDGRKPCPLLGDWPNPHITLDGGGEVWGCECWWGPEEKIREHIGTRKVEPVDIAAHRCAVAARNPS